MVGRILELSRDGLAVHKSRGFLSVREDGSEIGKAELDDIDAVLVSAQGLMWSNTALAQLAAQNVPVMVLGPNFAPAAVVLPLAGHGEQGYRMTCQAAASQPLRKQIWARLVRQKIAAQATLLDEIGCASERVKRLSYAVRSGDPDNREGQAAQAYWPLLFGKAFRRDRNMKGANAMLNYGYAVLRAATARAVVSSGLHPSLSVHHKSGGDPLALADDLMEPFRPTVDMTVYSLLEEGITTVSDSRHNLVGILSACFETEQGTSPLSQILVRLAQSVTRSFVTGKADLMFPRSLLPVDEVIDDNS
ncbi:type II CRISPR-associated endonuclease Cas1 [Thalassovita aquimarina]|uniref:CRISPR-associated endonuclease Cas1 n=1 Tax=Thalassovita aquimarina TaxID=2785917 RepID=A0ABS5HSH8_9RHOB|nr:type II CRISPR-associated endonuclease Cas1 [Thalassovita aquimarina]MBR9651936.1 type II CRISPR-associated endonuclease Cas1 [Thalassovita aquimarina]